MEGLMQCESLRSEVPMEVFVAAGYCTQRPMGGRGSGRSGTAGLALTFAVLLSALAVAGTTQAAPPADDRRVFSHRARVAGSSSGSASLPPLRARRTLQDDAVDLCGDSCEGIALGGEQKLDERTRRRRNCRATWGAGCATTPPPRGFSATSTLWEMCPHSCPADIRPATLPPPPPPPPTEPTEPTATPPPPPTTTPPPPPPVVVPSSAVTAVQEARPAPTASPKAGPDDGAMRAEIRRKMLGAAWDFLYAMCAASLSIIGAVYYCRHRKRQMKRMGMGSSKGHGRSKKGDGPKPPPWPPGKPGVSRGLSKMSDYSAIQHRKSPVRIAEETPLYSIAEDWGSSEEEPDDYAPAATLQDIRAVHSKNFAASEYGQVPTVVVTDRGQALAGMV